MIAEFMFYGTAVALMIGLAGLALERVPAWRRLPRRGIWAATLVLSATLPALFALEPPRTPAPREIVSAAARSLPQTVNPMAAISEAPDATLPVALETLPRQPSLGWPRLSSFERVIEPIWVFASLGLLSFYAVLSLRLRVAARHWRRALIDEEEVWITEMLGPAVYGFFKPVVLIPRWTLDAPRQLQTVVLTHEREHIAAHDPQLLLLGLLVVAIAPWNLPLWWQLRRLRFAIEVDCDVRVLARGAEPTAYGEALLTIGQRRTFTPVGAIALTEPASQLLRRIQIMTTELPNRGRWWVGAAVGLSLACIAVAVELQAPSLGAIPARPAIAAGPLQKPPLAEDPRVAIVQNAVRATYPELFSAAAAPTPVLVTLVLNRDGTLYKSVKEDMEPIHYVPTSVGAFDTLGVEFEYRHDMGLRLRMEGWPATHNYIDVRALFRKAVADPTRDVALVRKQVKAHYESLLSSQSRDSSKRLTVFMTESGDIDRAKVERALSAGPETLASPEHFVAMGVPREQIGPIGMTELHEGHYLDDPDAKQLTVIYAWPRRPNEPAPKPWQPQQPEPVAPNDNPAVNRALAEHYFPDLYTYPKEWPRADPWVLLDRQGNVLKTGRRVANSGWDVMLYVESRYPGIKTDGFQATTAYGDHGQWGAVGFVWLAADSPVTDPAKADLSKRRDLLLYADVVGDGKTWYTELLAMKFGSPAIGVAGFKNPFGVFHVEFTAADAGPDAVQLRMRAQRAPFGPTVQLPGAIPDAVEADWSPETAPVRVRYDESAEVHVTDREQITWTLVLHPTRLKGSAL